MIKEKMDCIDCGTEYCPCKLAEAGECIICSQLHGECFCDCVNWKGVCVYQEFYNNGMRAKEGRKTYNCKVVKAELLEEELMIIKFESPHKLALDLVKPGSYIFIRTDENYFFDIPISIMESDIENNIITVVIEVRGVKTKRLKEIKNGQNIVIRGPYWNGVFGLDNIGKQIENNCVVLARGIGMAPMMPVIRKLAINKNEVDVYVDKAPFKEDFSKEYVDKFDVSTAETNLLDKGKLSEEGRFIISQSIKDKNISFIHLAGADILTYSVVEYLDEIGRSDILLSCCNNFKMCCGEGVCGACTARFSGHRVKRFCKLQSDPRSIFEGRRFI
ncbi:sulfide/dihydroorotate dehydrogenase-like FAD/NAD-binding protein [Clostridium paraputrificum]|uniref:sulfide/dihydroorotate dehydrogenase-like FAD/NAD-binding protein n=1 Tax=Clostridium TaxID=1485 RepID=UPI003D32EFE7